MSIVVDVSTIAYDEDVATNHEGEAKGRINVSLVFHLPTLNSSP